jgi:hypothetical protein
MIKEYIKRLFIIVKKNIGAKITLIPVITDGVKFLTLFFDIIIISYMDQGIIAR